MCFLRKIIGKKTCVLGLKIVWGLAKVWLLAPNVFLTFGNWQSLGKQKSFNNAKKTTQTYSPFQKPRPILKKKSEANPTFVPPPKKNNNSPNPNTNATRSRLPGITSISHPKVSKDLHHTPLFPKEKDQGLGRTKVGRKLTEKVWESLGNPDRCGMVCFSSL